jgi:hypothetical protein
MINSLAIKKLKELLISGQVCVHPFVVSELSCGNMSNRKEILTLLRALPGIEPVLDEEVFGNLVLTAADFKPCNEPSR